MKKEYIKVKISELKPWVKNPKKHDEQLIESSVREFGYIEPIIIDEKNQIISGHGRLKVLKKLGIQEVDVIRIEGLTEGQKEKYALIANKAVERGGWDLDILKEFDEGLLKDVGFDDTELDNIFGFDIDDEFDVEKELNKILNGKERRVKDGDLWQLGEHRLYIGDATKRESWEKVLGDERFDFLFTDPPYKLAYTKRRFKGWVKTKKGFGYRAQRSYLGVEKKGGVPEYDEWLSIANEFQNPNGANVMIFENWRNTVPLWQAIEKYWKIRNMIIWWLPNRHQGFSREYLFFNKYDIAPLAGDGVLNEEYEEELENYLKEKGQKLLDTYEIILYGQKGDSYWERKKKTKWAKVSDHITWTAEETIKGRVENIIFGKKPIQILVPYIKILSPRNGIVVDCFGGSGSTLIACEIMKRKCRAIEIEPIYGEVIINRWERFTGGKAMKIE